MLSNFEITVTGESAEAMSHVYACHNAEGLDDWDIYDLYRHGLKRQNGDWKIMEMTLMVHGQKGNKAFLQQVGSQ